METIHYISDFTYFSGKKVSPKYGNVLNALREHIRYIARKEQGVFTFNLNPKGWLEKAKTEILKRWDSRVALKFVMALPLNTNQENVNEIAKVLQDFIAKELNVNPENVSIAIHLHKGKSGNYNPHAHILVYPRDRNGKKLRLNRKDLSRFHRKWQETLKRLGFKIRFNPDDLKIPHLGVKLYYDKTAQELYKTYLMLKEKQKTVKWLEENHARRSSAGAELLGKGEEFEVKELDAWKDYLKRLINKDAKNFREKQKKALAKHFKRLGYNPKDKIAIVLVNHRTGKTLQRVVKVEDVLTDKYLAFLSGKNAEGYSVYASINVLKDNAKKRRKEDFKPKQKRIYLDLDAKNVKSQELIHKLYDYLNLKGLPQPSHIVKSSKGNYQVYWTLDEDVDFQTLERIMLKMNIDLGLDHTQDVSRVFRLPYFRNKKPNKDDLVVNIDALNVLVNGKKVGQIKATGKTVKFEDFERLVEEKVDLPQPKHLSIDGLDPEIERIVENERRQKEIKEIKEFQSLGFKRETAEYYKLLSDLIDELCTKEIEDYYIDLKQFVKIAFERNKDKSPSEIDLALVGLIFKRFNGKPPLAIKRFLRQLLKVSAKRRGKRTPETYVNLTLSKVESYYDKPINVVAQKVKGSLADKLAEKQKHKRGRGFPSSSPKR